MASPPIIRAYERELHVFARLWRGVAFSTFVVPLLFLGAMGLGLGRFVDDGAGAANLGGLDYLVFVAPGLLVASAMQTAAGESLWPVLSGFKWMGFYNGLVNTPLRPADAYGGHVLWTGTRVLMAATSFVFVAALLGAIPSPWAVLAIPVTVLTGLAFAAPISAYAAGCETDQTFSLIMRLGVIPLFLFSGTFFPIEQLPGAIQPLAWLSPLWHGVEPVRSFTTGDIDLPAVVGHLAVLVAIISVSWRWGTRQFTRRLSP